MKTEPREVKGKIVNHRRISPEYYTLRIQAPEIARAARPGQFVMIRLDDTYDPLLRRPFGFSRILPPNQKRGGGFAEGGFEICYQVVGRGTARLTRLREGERADVLGPLGRGFWREEGRERLILVGGGIGIAPLLPWAEELGGRKAGTREVQPEILLGGRDAHRLLGVREIKRMGLEPQIATEDGSAGLRGTATDLLERDLLSKGDESKAIYACGPMPMLAKVAQIAEQFDVPCQVLLESRMACGVGACLGCAVKIRAEGKGEEEEEEENLSASKGGLCRPEEETEIPLPEEMAARISPAPNFRYGRVCLEGPVFRAQEILWE